jgi:serine/threonine protein kinase
LFGVLQLDILQVAIDIAAGMQHLHSKHIVHGDLNPTNVLLHQDSAPHSLTRNADATFCGSPDGMIMGGASPAPGAAASGAGGRTAAAAAAAGAGGEYGGGGGSQGEIKGGQQQQQHQEQQQQQMVRGLHHEGAQSWDSQEGNGGNGLVTRQLAKIADFGLSVKMPANATHVSGHRVGTPFYVAPEVAQKGRMNKVRCRVVCWWWPGGKRWGLGGFETLSANIEVQDDLNGLFVLVGTTQLAWTAAVVLTLTYAFYGGMFIS